VILKSKPVSALLERKSNHLMLVGEECEKAVGWPEHKGKIKAIPKDGLSIIK
jgi:hypothetical protein